MKFQFFCLSVILSVILFGCSSNKPKSASDGTSKLDVLTDFSVAINENNFMKAINFLVEEDRLQLLSGGSVTDMAQKQLKALRLQKLIKDRRIGMREGKLTGIVMVMPKLEFITKGSAELPPEELAPAPEEASGTPPAAPGSIETEPATPEPEATAPESLPEVPAASEPVNTPAEEKPAE